MSQLQTKISFLQYNTNRNQNIMHSCLEIAIKSSIDFVLIQEPWIAFNNNAAFTISHPSYYCILPNTLDIRSRVAIFARKLANYQFCYRTDLTSDSDMIIIDVSGEDIETFQVINIYNEKSLDSEADNSYTMERSLQYIQLSYETLIVGDFNAHHSWWNSSVTNSIRSDSLITWLNSYSCELINEPDISTFFRSNLSTNSVIDLSFATQKLYSLVSDWYIDDSNASGSDHEIIIFSIRTRLTELIDNLICSEFFNTKKADWKLFSENLLLESNNIDFSNLENKNNLDIAAKTLENLIYLAAEKSISKLKLSERSKP